MSTRQAISADYKKLSDDELVYRYVHKHEQDAMCLIFDRYGHIVFGICLKYLNDTNAARNATQQIFTRLLDDVVKYKIEQFKPWFFDMVRKHCRMQSGKSIAVSGNSLESYGQDAENDDWQHMLLQESKLAVLEKELGRLNDEQRSMMEMFYLQQASYSDIAAKRGTTKNKVMQVLQTTRKKLVSIVSGEGKRNYE